MNLKKTFTPLVLLLFLSTTGFPQLAGIGNTEHTFTDPGRGDRPILTEIYFPVDENGDLDDAGSSYPLLIFGHGFLMTWSAYENLWTHFVPRGYVMAFPRTEGGFSPSHLDFGLDIAFLAGAIQEWNDDPDSPLYQQLSGQSVAMGHSMGGGAAVLASSLSEHIDGLLVLAPAETNPSAIAAAQEVTIPSLVISGSADDVTPEDVHQLPIYEALQSDTKTFIRIMGGGHCFFANSNFFCDLGESGTSGNITLTRQEQQEITAAFATPWLDYLFRNDCSAWQALQDSLDTSEQVEFLQQSLIQTPEASLVGDTLYSSPANLYQWLFGGELIEGAQGEAFFPLQSGSYSVEVQYHNLCTYQSNELFFIRPGDANQDGQINVLDVISVIAYFLEDDPEPFDFQNADVNQDEQIDVLDAIAIISLYLNDSL